MRYRAILHLLALLLATSLFPSALATAEPRPDAPTYARRGPFAVGVRDVIIPGVTGDLLVTIWYPAIQSDSFAKAIYQIGPVMGTGEALREADPDLSAGPYPLIIFSHGLGGARIQSIFYTEHLAAYGFVVMAADHPGSSFTDLLLGNRDGVLKSFGARPLEVLKQLEYADSASKSDGFLAGLVDTERVGVTGHSFGGYTTVSAGGGQIDLRDVRQDCASGKAEGFNCDFVAREMILAEIRGLSSLPEGLYPPTTDPRIKAIVPLAPSSGPLFGKEGAAQVKIPMLIIVGSKDRSTVPERDAYPIMRQQAAIKSHWSSWKMLGTIFLLRRVCQP